jgi:hypothetical protein
MCNQCASRCLTYYQDQARPNIIYCPDCYQKNQQEEQSTTYCHYCNDKSDGFYTCDKEECINKMTKEAEKSQLQQSIAELENKPHKTQEEEAELDRKKKELARLNNQQSQPQKEKNQ